MSRGRSLADRYRRFADAEFAGTSPLYARVALTLSESDAALAAISKAPGRKRHPRLILAALHYLARSGDAPDLAAAFAGKDGETAAEAAIVTLLQNADAVASIVDQRLVRTGVSGYHAVLYPAIAEVARQAEAKPVGLIDVGCGAALNLDVGRVGITYSDGEVLGDRSSSVQVSASIRGDRSLPARPIPEVVARIGVDPDPVDVTDTDEVRWLLACLPPDQPELAADLEAQVVLAATSPPLLLRGDAIESLPAAFAHVPADVLPVVTTTWALSELPLEKRLRFLHCLDDAAEARPVAWVSAEGVGVAPAIPTLGDRRASGHSIIGLALFDHSTMRTEAIGRCWSRGRILQWLADS